MAADEVEASQSGMESGGAAGPGAPMPLSELEVCISGEDDRWAKNSCDDRVSLGFRRETYSWSLKEDTIQSNPSHTRESLQLIGLKLYQLADGEFSPRRLLEQIKGISEQKATKILTEGMSLNTIIASIFRVLTWMQHRSWSQWASRPQPKCTSDEVNSSRSLPVRNN